VERNEQLQAAILHLEEVNKGRKPDETRAYLLTENDVRTLKAGTDRTTQKAIENGHFYIAAAFQELSDKLNWTE
jgi:hypothetical protein